LVSSGIFVDSEEDSVGRSSIDDGLFDHSVLAVSFEPEAALT
jgi:hypothetical protein